MTEPVPLGGPSVPASDLPSAPYRYPGTPPDRPLTWSAAMWAHLAPLLVAVVVGIASAAGAVYLLPFIWLPAVIIRRVRSNRRDALVRNHTAQSLNSILTGYLTLIPAIGLTVLYATSGAYRSGSGYLQALAIAATVVVWVCAVARGIAAFVFAIIGATRARAGQYVRFPVWVAFPMVPDSTPEPGRRPTSN